MAQDNTVFDSVFKTMLRKAPRLMIPLINEVFGRQYPEDADLVQFADEHQGLKGTTIDDSVFRLNDKIYYVECQSTPDTDMVVRMIEYDFSIALEQALTEGPPYRMEFPASCVLFLRHTSKTPDVLRIEVALPDGGSFEYRTKVVKAQLVSSEELFKKRLLVLLPYYLLRYERELTKIAADDELSMRLVAECTELRMRLADATLDVGDDLLYEELTELTIRVSDHLLERHKALQKRVRAAMGGEVLELLNDRAERMEREAHEQGLKLGIEQGIEQGIEKGIEQGIEKGLEQGIEQGVQQGLAQGKREGHDQAVRDLSERLRSLGVDQATIDSAIASMESRPNE